MNRLIKYLTIFLILHPIQIFAQPSGPDFNRVESSLRIIKDSVQSPSWPRKYIYIFRPDTTAILPCVLFLPKFGMNDPQEYQSLINHIVSKKMIVIIPPYGPLRLTRDQISKNLTYLRLFNESVNHSLEHIDTTRIGFVGHGLGGGLTPSLVRQVIQKKGWGKSGTFMYIMAPWYFFNITERELTTFPEKVYSIIEVFDDDNINDPRIASTLFNKIGLSVERKKFVIVYSDNSAGCKLKADNHTPLCENDILGENNILDTIAIMSIFDTLVQAAFSSTTQSNHPFFCARTPCTIPVSTVSCPSVKPILVTDTPDKYVSLKPYMNSWKSIRNPYIEKSSFQKSRKLFFKYRKDQIQKVASHLIESKKAENSNEVEDDLIFDNPISSGYGADGIYTVVHDSITSPLFDGEHVYLFRPELNDRKWPVVFMLHGYGGSDYHYFEPFITHVASKGYAILYSPYPQIPFVNSEERVLQKQQIIKAGIEAGITAYSRYIDTTKIAFFGQSFGSGQIPALTWWAINEKNWGKEAAFMMITAPWYTYGITQDQLQNFPSHVKLQMIVFNDDQTNDHQMGIDLFKSISIPDQEKDFIVFYSDSLDGYVMHANHFVPYGLYNIYGEENLLDYYGTNKLFDALADYTFNKNRNAKVVALGNGSSEQIYMGKLSEKHPVHPLAVTDAPEAQHSELNYFFAWNNPLNPRRSLYSTDKPFVRKIKDKIETIRSKNKE